MSIQSTHRFNLFSALREVFGRLSYIFLAIGVSCVFFAFAVWLPNLRLIAHTLLQVGVAINTKLALLLNLLQGIGTNFTIFSAITTVIIAILFGINIAMIAYFVKKRRAADMQSSGVFAGIGGIGSGIVGIGCAACGSLVLSAILPVVVAAGVIALLPFKGREFSIISIGLIFTSIVLMGRKITKPPVCDV